MTDDERIILYIYRMFYICSSWFICIKQMTDDECAGDWGAREVYGNWFYRENIYVHTYIHKKIVYINVYI